MFFLLFLYYFQPGYGRHSTAPSHPVALVQRKVLGKWLMATQTTPIARGRNVGYFYVFFLYFCFQNSFLLFLLVIFQKKFFYFTTFYILSLFFHMSTFYKLSSWTRWLLGKPSSSILRSISPFLIEFFRQISFGISSIRQLCT